MQSPMPPREKSLRRRACEKRLVYAKQQANVDHILDAVGLEHVPKWINTRRLREDINMAGVLAASLAELDSSRTWRERVERLEKIERTARRLRRLLSDDVGRWAQQELGQVFPLGEGGLRRQRRDPAPSVTGLVFGLARLARAARRKREQTTPDAPWRQDESVSDWLLGRHLPKIYERWIRRPAGRSRTFKADNGKADGPYIRFACLVTNELGYQYSEETVVKALSNIKSGAKRRRKPKGEIDAR